MKADELDRRRVKTPQQQFVQRLEQDYRLAPRVAQAVLADAQLYLTGGTAGLPPGQMRVLLSPAQRGASQALRASVLKTVVWTIDAGTEDDEVLAQYGERVLRQVRLQRLLGEAVEQGALASQEDVARVLHVSVRTIKRDCAELAAQGSALPTRGQVQGIGRGQTHKAHIVGRWLQGQTYDQIAQHTQHSLSSIQRYVQTFLRGVRLHGQGVSDAQIAQVVQIGPALVQEYLAVQRQHDTPAERERLVEHLQRVERADPPADPQAEKGAR